MKHASPLKIFSVKNCVSIGTREKNGKGNTSVKHVFFGKHSAASRSRSIESVESVKTD
jgi:hypothetical protein